MGLFAAFGGSPLKGAARKLRLLRVLSANFVGLGSNPDCLFRGFESQIIRFIQMDIL